MSVALCTAAGKMILNIHTLIVFLHFTIQWWISLSMPSLKTKFHTYLIRSSKQFLYFVILSHACHQTHREGASSNLHCTFTTTPSLLECQLSQVCIYHQIFEPWLCRQLQSQCSHNGSRSHDRLANEHMNLNDMIVHLKNMSMCSS